MSIVNVALPIPLIQTFDYILPVNIMASIGGRIRVPFGTRQKIGIVLEIRDHSEVALDKLKPIIHVIDSKSLFPENLWQILNWAINYYHYPAGEVLFHALPVLLRQGTSLTKIQQLQWFITELGRNIELNVFKRAPKQKKALTILLNKPIPCHQISKLKLTKMTLQVLKAKGLCDLQPQQKDIKDWRLYFSVNHKRPQLNIEQSFAVNAIHKQNNQFVAWLLAGVTGSGKTEVYMTVIENILFKGQQALVLVPEISLTPQTLKRFRNRFNVPIEVLHSRVNNYDRLSVWLKAQHGECAIIIGTRSALFTPFAQLGIIIIDEEHDSSYKQHEGWRYHARDLAVLRAQKENITIVLGTATPSFETLYNVQQKKYYQLTLDKRAGNAQIYNQQLLDIRKLPMINGLSFFLLHKIRTHLRVGNQVLLFLNRRGFAPTLLCHECGWIAECLRCDHYYTLHKYKNQLCCHHCNNYRSLTTQCPKCGSTELITVGIGTEQLEVILTPLFPDIPITRIDHDTITHTGVLESYLSKIQRGGAHILIGTQMLAKGHHFPNVTLVSLLDVDNALFSDDFRATERFAQLYTQVAGRAGRSGKQGEVLLQTHYPEHPLLQTLMQRGYMDFAKQSLEERCEAKLPPFHSHILFRADDVDNQQASLFLKNLQQLFNTNQLYDDNLWFIGPIPALIPKRNGRFHWQLLLSHPSRSKLQRLITICLPLVNNILESKKVRWSLDVDPIDH